MLPNKFPTLLAGLLKPAALLILLSSVVAPVWGQSKQVILKVLHGKVRYMSKGQWNYVNTTICLDDTCVIETMEESVSYRLVMDNLCAEVKGKCKKQARDNVFNICDATPGSFMNILMDMYRYLQQPEPKKVPARQIASTGLWFPVTGELLTSMDAFQLQHVTFNNAPTLAASTRTHAYSFFDVTLRNAWIEDCGLTTNSLSQLLDPTDSVTLLLTFSYQSKAILHKDQFSDVIDFNFFQDDKTPVSEYFFLANTDTLSEVFRTIDRLSDLKTASNEQELELYKAIIYTRHRMYTKAAEVYMTALLKYPDNDLIKSCWTNFVNEVALKNSAAGLIFNQASFQ